MNGQQNTYTFRGRSLDELVPKIREQLGDDAIIVARRETTSGGVGGFFARREIEVDVRPPHATGTATAFADELAEAHDRQLRPAVSPEVDALPSAADVSVDDLFPSPPQAEGLAALFNAGLPAKGDAPRFGYGAGEEAPRVEEEPHVEEEAPRVEEPPAEDPPHLVDEPAAVAMP